MLSMMSILSVAVLGGLSLYMFANARFEITKRVAMVPAAMTLVEMWFAGVWSQTAYPVLTALLLALKVAALCIGVVAIRQDAAMARRREARRRLAARQTLCAMHDITCVEGSARTAKMPTATRRVSCA